MIADHDRRRRAASYGERPDSGAFRPVETPPFAPPAPGLRRFLGGSPMAVLVKLLVLSVIVGAAMAMLGLTPGLLFWHLYDAARWLIDLGLATFHDFGRWILAGAVVVVPLWLISRFLAMGR